MEKSIPITLTQPDTDGQTESENEAALKKALQEAQIKIICLETMIDIAEKELNVNIRKKSGTKQ
jgi:hypothetical protein